MNSIQMNNEFETDNLSQSEKKNEFNIVYDKLSDTNRDEIKDFAEWLVKRQKTQDL